MATLNSISLLIILGVVLSATAQLLAEVPAPPPDDGRSKIGVSPSTPKRDGSWSGGSSPQGTLLVPPPSSVTKIGFASTNVTANGTTSTTSSGTTSTTSSGTTSTTSGGTTSTTSSRTTSMTSTTITSNETVTGDGGAPPP